MHVVTMPQLGETVTEGTIVSWFKQVGDAIAVDDVLFEVSTDKVDTEVPSAHAGFLRAIHVGPGETVPIGTPLALVSDTADEPLPETPAAPAAPAPAARAESSRAGSPARGTTTAARPRTEVSDGSGFLSPAVRELLAEHGLRAGDVVGSGRDGRITRNDVLAAAARPAPAPVAAAPAGQRPGTHVGAEVEPGEHDEVVELSNIRRVTAEHMVRSQATSAHTLVAMEVDYSAVDKARRGTKLSYLPFIARAVVDAIARYPHVNAVLGADRLVVRHEVHLGIAVDLDFQGLVVPVVRDAGGMRLQALAEAISDVARKARAKRLTADAFTGGTFTITNAGGYGTLLTVPIINQPQVAILGTDGVRMRPVAVRSEGSSGEWVVAVRPIGNLALSFDHRAYDGAYASAFLATVRDTLETRDWSGEM